MKEVADSVFVETGNLGSNNGAIFAERGMVLVDSPLKPSDACTLRRELDALTGGVAGEDCFLVHTDHHIDHVMGNPFLPGIVVAHRGTREGIERECGAWESVLELVATVDPEGAELAADVRVRLPPIVFDATAVLHLGDVAVELMHAPGHTPNTIAVFLPDRGVLFTGDTVCEAGLPSFEDASAATWLATIDELARLDADLVVPGHGEVGSMAIVRRFRDEVEELVDRVTRAIEAGVSRAEAPTVVTVEDRIHTGTARYAGYPPETVQRFHVASIQRLYDDVARGARP